MAASELHLKLERLREFRAPERVQTSDLRPVYDLMLLADEFACACEWSGCYADIRRGAACFREWTGPESLLQRELERGIRALKAAVEHLLEEKGFKPADAPAAKRLDQFEVAFEVDKGIEHLVQIAHDMREGEGKHLCILSCRLGGILSGLALSGERAFERIPVTVQGLEHALAEPVFSEAAAPTSTPFGMPMEAELESTRRQLSRIRQACEARHLYGCYLIDECRRVASPGNSGSKGSSGGAETGTLLAALDWISSLVASPRGARASIRALTCGRKWEVRALQFVEDFRSKVGAVRGAAEDVYRKTVERFGWGRGAVAGSEDEDSGEPAEGEDEQGKDGLGGNDQEASTSAEEGSNSPGDQEDTTPQPQPGRLEDVEEAPSSPTQQRKGGKRREWLRPPNEDPPPDFKDKGPIRGKLGQLAEWVGEAIGVGDDPRQLVVAVVSDGIVWIRGRGQRLEAVLKRDADFAKAIELQKQAETTRKNQR